MCLRLAPGPWPTALATSALGKPHLSRRRTLLCILSSVYNGAQITVSVQVSARKCKATTIISPSRAWCATPARSTVASVPSLLLALLLLPLRNLKLHDFHTILTLASSRFFDFGRQLQLSLRQLHSVLLRDPAAGCLHWRLSRRTHKLHLPLRADRVLREHMRVSLVRGKLPGS